MKSRWAQWHRDEEIGFTVGEGAAQPFGENASFIQIAVVFELMNQLINWRGIPTRDKGAIKLSWVAEAFAALRIVCRELYTAAVASGRGALQAIAAAMAKGRMMWDLGEAK